MNLLPEGINRLEYSESQRLFHFERNTDKNGFGWAKLKSMSDEDCIQFCEFMDKKYVNGRSTGVLPELSIVVLELSLFFGLKTHRRKLAGRL